MSVNWEEEIEEQTKKLKQSWLNSVVNQISNEGIDYLPNFEEIEERD